MLTFKIDEIFLDSEERFFQNFFHIFDENIVAHWIKPSKSGTYLDRIKLNGTLNLESSADKTVSNLKGGILVRLENLIPT